MTESQKRSSLTEIIPFDENIVQTSAELFQNTVLRPVLKYQNELLSRTALDFCISLDPEFMNLPGRKQRSLMDKTLSGNQPLRNLLTGIVLGMLDPEQLVDFLKDRKDLSKRIQTMVKERVMDQFGSFLSV